MASQNKEQAASQKKIEAIYDRAGKACRTKGQTHLKRFERVPK
jgi:hypothetical protein